MTPRPNSHKGDSMFFINNRQVRLKFLSTLCIVGMSIALGGILAEPIHAYMPLEWRVKYPKDMRSHGWRIGWEAAGGRVVDDFHSTSLNVTDVLPWSSSSTAIYHSSLSDRRIHGNGWVIPYSDTPVCCKHGLQQTACVVMKVNDSLLNSIIPYKHRQKEGFKNTTASGALVCPPDAKIRAIRIYTNPLRWPSDPLVLSHSENGKQRILAHELFHGLGWIGSGVHCQPDSITRTQDCTPTPYELTPGDHTAILNEYP